VAPSSLFSFYPFPFRGEAPVEKNWCVRDADSTAPPAIKAVRAADARLRGASFNNNDRDNLVSSNRNTNDDRNNNSGFRVVGAVG
jgi:hypothetical protein